MDEIQGMRALRDKTGRVRAPAGQDAGNASCGWPRSEECERFFQALDNLGRVRACFLGPGSSRQTLQAVYLRVCFEPTQVCLQTCMHSRGSRPAVPVFACTSRGPVQLACRGGGFVRLVFADLLLPRRHGATCGFACTRGGFIRHECTVGSPGCSVDAAGAILRLLRLYMHPSCLIGMPAQIPLARGGWAHSCGLLFLALCCPNLHVPIGDMSSAVAAL